MRWSRRDVAPVPTMPPPRDIECLEMVSQALETGVESELDAYCKTTQVMVAELGLAYGAVWLPDGAGELSLRVEHGDLLDALRSAGAQEPTLRLGGRAPVSNRAVALDESSPAPLAARWRAAQDAGAFAGAVIPIVQGGELVAVQEFYSRVELPFFGGRGKKWEAIGRLLENARRSALTGYELNETLADRRAVTVVVGRVGAAADEHAALATALEDIRAGFGWTWASFWTLDEAAGVLQVTREAGSASEAFRRATWAESCAEGVGLVGRAWRMRDLVFVSDLGDQAGELRGFEARRCGLHSAVCVPIVVNGRFLGAMEFVGREVRELSESRSTALRDVQLLVCQRLGTLRRAEADASSARELLETVDALRESALSAGQVAEEAVARASAMTRDVRALSVASREIGDVIKIISRIAGQTNLLSLNATIEAARAGAAGRGFGVVAAEVKDLARETAAATQKVADQIAGIQATSGSVSAGIEATSDIIGQLDAVQARIMRVLDRQAAMAGVFDHA